MSTNRANIFVGLLTVSLSWNVWILQINNAINDLSINYYDVISEVFSIFFILMMFTVLNLEERSV